MSDEQKNREEGVNLENILNDADMMDKVDWRDFWEKCDIEQDLQDACEDLRKAYQSFD